MIENVKGYSYNDLTIVPSTISNISSRSECNPYVKDNFLPIFASPMASVVNIENYDLFIENGIIPIIPRNIANLEKNKEQTLKCINEQMWVALSLKDFEDLFIEHSYERINDFRTAYFIVVDIANGHMKSLYDKCVKAKELARDNGYKLTIMTGNIANPETYEWICRHAGYLDKNGKRVTAIDYIRVGVGGGSGCFIDGTKIKTKKGLKNIEQISNGEYVMTIDGSYQKVISTIRYKTDDLIKINNEITSTKNHKYFVINKIDKELVNEDNLQKYGYWIEASKLDKEKHLLVKKY